MLQLIGTVLLRHAGTQSIRPLHMGALDTLLALVLADVMRGTGRYSTARGVVGTVQGVESNGRCNTMAEGLR